MEEALRYRGPPPMEESLFHPMQDLDDFDCATSELVLPSNSERFHLQRARLLRSGLFNAEDGGIVKDEDDSSYEESGKVPPVTSPFRAVPVSESVHTAPSGRDYWDKILHTVTYNPLKKTSLIRDSRVSRNVVDSAGRITNVFRELASQEKIPSIGLNHLHTPMQPPMAELSPDSTLVLEYLNRLVPANIDPDVKNWRKILGDHRRRRIKCPLPGLSDAIAKRGRCALGGLAVLYWIWDKS